MRETAYGAEDVLQQLIEEHPEMLGGDDAAHGKLILVRREAGVSDQEDAGARWSLDHLYLDANGVPTLVEVKRTQQHAEPPRGRRADARLRSQRENVFQRGAHGGMARGNAARPVGHDPQVAEQLDAGRPRELVARGLDVVHQEARHDQIRREEPWAVSDRSAPEELAVGALSSPAPPTPAAALQARPEVPALGAVRGCPERLQAPLLRRALSAHQAPPPTRPKVAQIDPSRRLTEAIWHPLIRNQPFAPAGAPLV
jgi:hypothetical protein